MREDRNTVHTGGEVRDRVIQGYRITDSRIVGSMELVLAENPKAPQPFATWMRNMKNDEMSGQENFFWGHYFVDKNAADRDFRDRVNKERESISGARPSVLEDLKALRGAVPRMAEGTADRGKHTVKDIKTAERG